MEWILNKEDKTMAMVHQKVQLMSLHHFVSVRHNPLETFCEVSHLTSECWWLKSVCVWGGCARVCVWLVPPVVLLNTTSVWSNLLYLHLHTILCVFSQVLKIDCEFKNPAETEEWTLRTLNHWIKLFQSCYYCFCFKYKIIMYSVSYEYFTLIEPPSCLSV